MMKPKLTRREVVVAGGLGVAGAVAASLPAPGAAAGVAATPERELRVLAGLLGTERVLEYAYGRVLRGWTFNSEVRGALELIHRHEIEHAAVLEHQIAALGGGLSPAGGAGGARSALSDVESQLSGAQTPRDALRVLTKVESLAEANYFNAVGELMAAHLALMAAQILGSEAQHWTLLLNVLTEGHLPELVPAAYVRGVAHIS
jgi:hypothetical protein